MHTLLDAARRRLQGSLGARLVALTLGLLALVQIASFTALSQGLERHARETLPERLVLGDRVVGNLLQQQARQLLDGAGVLARDWGLREAIASQDEATVLSALENHGERLGATQVVLLKEEGARLATVGRTGRARWAAETVAERLRARAAAGGQPEGLAMIGGMPHQVVMAALPQRDAAAWVLMAIPLDAALARQLHELSALDLTVLARTGADTPWQPVLTGLDPARAKALAARPWSSRGPAVEGMHSIVLDGEEVGVHGRWLDTADSGAAALALVSVSIDVATRTPRALQLGLLAITLVAFAVFALGAWWTARHVTTPLRELGEAAERLGAGDYATPVDGHGRTDEIGQLALGFERMRASVAEKQQQILQLAWWDPLTGLPNRVQFREALQSAITRATARGSAAGVAVLMLDLDRFKRVNDVLGYPFGDRMLKAVAERLTGRGVRDGDIVARLSGDEFALLLPDGDATLATAVARRIAHGFDAPLVLGDQKVDASAGIGIACWPAHGTDADTLLGRAEIAMYAAKRRGDHEPRVYDASLDAGSSQTLTLLSELRHAIEHGELRLFLQPKLSLTSGTVVGAEALVRWLHPHRGMVPPMQFIPFAEETGFIRQLTMWVFAEAGRVWLDLQSQGLMVKLAVNLSARDLMDAELPRKFGDLLEENQVPAEAFCLEITESAIMEDTQRALATLERLSQMGFRLSIDDFGTGYSSLAYLKRLPVDELKIDKSFVMNMERDLDDAQIVRSTIDLAHNLGLQVVAEGVENGRVWEMLRELRCDQAQGYHMGKPMPAEQFRTWSVGWTDHRKPFSKSGAMRLH